MEKNVNYKNSCREILNIFTYYTYMKRNLYKEKRIALKENVDINLYRVHKTLSAFRSRSDRNFIFFSSRFRKQDFPIGSHIRMMY